MPVKNRTTIRTAKSLIFGEKMHLTLKSTLTSSIIVAASFSSFSAIAGVSEDVSAQETLAVVSSESSESSPVVEAKNTPAKAAAAPDTFLKLAMHYKMHQLALGFASAYGSYTAAVYTGVPAPIASSFARSVGIGAFMPSRSPEGSLIYGGLAWLFGYDHPGAMMVGDLTGSALGALANKAMGDVIAAE